MSDILKPGRPVGSKDYGRKSPIAREMKAQGLSWTNELIDAYKLYKKQMEAYDAGAERKPDNQLIQFWMELIPYICLTMSERPHRERPDKKVRKKISPQALEQLAKLEGR